MAEKYWSAALNIAQVMYLHLRHGEAQGTYLLHKRVFIGDD